jgi:hypothetical protein
VGNVSLEHAGESNTEVKAEGRRDEFVMSSLLETGIPPPPMCPEGTFCPDDSSICLPLVPLGGRCQLNRDGELREGSER